MKKIMIAIMSIMLTAGVLLADDRENVADEAKYYDNAKVIRVKNIEGEGFVQRSYDEGYEEATPNLPLFEKDTVGTTAGRLEIYLGRLNYLRLDSDTLVELQNIPQLRKTDLMAFVEKGAIYLDIENLDNEKSIQIQTPDCGVFILDKGVYRINVDENNLTEVYVMEGIAEVAGQESSRNVRENQKIVMSRGELEERPYYFYASEKDDFDRWNDTQNHEQGYARIGTSRYLQSGYEDYEYEMSRAGRWSYMSNFNSYVWIPYYSNASWMPYANGRWVYHPFYGNVWTSYDRCGWFTHHYGRWHWDYASGWYWIPAYHWSPAWVSWFGDHHYYGWSPLSWWNRPIIIINNHWDRNYNYRRGVPHHSRSTIIIRKNELSAPNMQRVALSKSNLGSTADKIIAYRGNASSERLATAKVTVINAKGKAVTYKQNGIVSAEKYKVSRDAGDGNKSVKDSTAVYKYNDVNNAGSKYSPRVIRSKGDEKDVAAGKRGYFSSKSDGESTAGARVKSSDSSSSGNNVQPKTKASSSSAGSAKSSSSAKSSTKAVKKKKDDGAYQALLRSENSAGYKSHAAGNAGSQAGYLAGNYDTERVSYRASESKTDTQPRSAANFSQAMASRFTSSSKAAKFNSASPFTGYVSRSGPQYDRAAENTRYSFRNFSTVSRNNRSYINGNSTSSRSYAPVVSSSSAVRSHGSSTRSSFSAPSRSSARAVASSSSQRSTTTTSAKKKN